MGRIVIRRASAVKSLIGSETTSHPTQSSKESLPS
jgi:hypothetical protein